MNDIAAVNMDPKSAFFHPQDARGYCRFEHPVHMRFEYPGSEEDYRDLRNFKWRSGGKGTIVVGEPLHDSGSGGGAEGAKPVGVDPVLSIERIDLHKGKRGDTTDQSS
jgi:hypothetical protein